MAPNDSFYEVQQHLVLNVVPVPPHDFVQRRTGKAISDVINGQEVGSAAADLTVELGVDLPYAPRDTPSLPKCVQTVQQRFGDHPVREPLECQCPDFCRAFGDFDNSHGIWSVLVLIVIVIFVVE